MSSDRPTIRVEGLGKRYSLRRRQAPATLVESIARRIRQPFARSERNDFWALKDVTFEVRQGEVVGLIGRNGSGKSTLLKILSRITEMTEGEAELTGRVGSLLEVGTGFHQDLTGRENIFMNGAMLGMTPSEIRQQFDAIVAFAGVEPFLDTAVKHYSSGMYVRLAFAVAAHLRSEILIVDEVLAVGDVDFQRRCLGKMRDISSDGRTVIFVSHNMHSISLLCSRAIVLDAGRISLSGTPAEAIVAYARQFATLPADGARHQNRPGTGEYRFSEVVVKENVVAPSQPRRVMFHVRHEHGALGRFYPSAHLFDETGQEIAHMDGRFVGCWIDGTGAASGELVMTGPWLRPGRYYLDMYLCSDSAVVDAFSQACAFEVTEHLPYPYSAGAVTVPSGAVLADFSWSAVSIADGVPAATR